mmetsp:Transcript_16048/g.37854  ORF Transcript_16048/g.37854 Transcript_16048/m.37854 type:complete len:195 (+) Transcript_16048:45-629(+)
MARSLEILAAGVVLLLLPTFGQAIVREAKATISLAGHRTSSRYDEVATVAARRYVDAHREQPDEGLRDKLDALATQSSALCEKLGEIADALPNESAAVAKVLEVHNATCQSVAYFSEKDLSDAEMEHRVQEGLRRTVEWRATLSEALEELQKSAMSRAADSAANQDVTVVTRTNLATEVANLESCTHMLRHPAR